MNARFFKKTGNKLLAVLEGPATLAGDFSDISICKTRNKLFPGSFQLDMSDPIGGIPIELAQAAEEIQLGINTLIDEIFNLFPPSEEDFAHETHIKGRYLGFTLTYLQHLPLQITQLFPLLIEIQNLIDDFKYKRNSISYSFNSLKREFAKATAPDGVLTNNPHPNLKEELQNFKSAIVRFIKKAFKYIGYGAAIGAGVGTPFGGVGAAPGALIGASIGLIGVFCKTFSDGKKLQKMLLLIVFKH